MTAFPNKDLINTPENRLTAFQKCEKVKQLFWKRWSIEYLNRLQNRPKWLAPQKNLEINQLVLIKEDNLPPLNWLLGRIIETPTGPDGKVRVVKVRTKNGILTRSITKICPLPE